MSTPGLYTPPDYTPPERTSNTWAGLERRSRDPTNQLGRSLNLLCLEASDTYEIAAHLEALGFNDPQKLASYGARDHFDLAARLFSRTPKRFTVKQRAVPNEQNVVRQLVMVLTLAVSFGIGLVASEKAWAPVLWLLVWSQAGSALLARARGDLDEHEHPPILALLLIAGLSGVGFIWLVAPFGLEALSLTLMWFGAAGLLWGKRYLSAFALPLLAAAFLGLQLWLGLNPNALLAAVSLSSLGLLLPLLVTQPSLRSLPWLARQLGYLLPFALYGLGQGCLLIELVEGSPAGAQILPGMLLFAFILFASEAHLFRLKRKLTQLLWREASTARYLTRARAAVLGYTAWYLLPLALGALAQLALGPQPWMFHWFGFALFGLVLGLSLVSLSLGNARAPATILALAGPLAFVAPFTLVAALSGVLQLLVILRQSRYVERYGIYLV